MLSVEWLGPVCGTCVFVYTTVWNTFFFLFRLMGCFIQQHQVMTAGADEIAAESASQIRRGPRLRFSE